MTDAQITEKSDGLKTPEKSKTDAKPQSKDTAAKTEASTPQRNVVHRTPSTDRRSGATNHAGFPVSVEELAKMSPIDRVKLGYLYLRELHRKERPSAGFVSRTGRDPHQTFVPACKSPQLLKREQMENERRQELIAKIHYDPDARPVQTDFVRTVSRTSRISSWSRDKTERRSLSTSNETIASRLAPQTPGPGYYTSPLLFLGA